MENLITSKKEKRPTAIVFGPELENKASGYGWVKHNICKALSDKMDVVSVHMIGSDTREITHPRKVISGEERSEEVFEIEEVGIHSIHEWENLLRTGEPDLILTVSDPEKSWFVPMSKVRSKKISYYISEAPTANRYFPFIDKKGKKYLDILRVLRYYNKIIPSTETSLYALRRDLGLEFHKEPKIITPPVWKWKTDHDIGLQYREDIGVEFDCKLFFSIATNNERKRLDQLLIFFKEVLLVKPCYRLVIHTSLSSGYDLVAIAERLGINGNVIINQKVGKKIMEGVFSAADTFVSLPSAEGYGLPFHEALLLGKTCYHTTVGEPSKTAKLVKNRNINLVSAKTPYFYKIGNQVWYAMDSKPKVTKTGKKGPYDIEDIINTEKTFVEKIKQDVSHTLGIDIT